MPNSLDEEETQCLLACEDSLTSTYCDDTDQDDIKAQANNNTRICNNSQEMNSSSSSSKLDFLSNNFEAQPIASNITSSSITEVPSLADTTHTVIHSNSASKDVVSSEYVVPTLAWADHETFNSMNSNKVDTEEDSTTDGIGKGHTNLIGDSCLPKEIKQCQKKIISSTSGKPVLQFIRQNPNEIKESAYTIDSTQNTFLAAGKAEQAFFSVCMEGNSSELPVPDSHTSYSIDVASKQDSISLDSKYSENEEDKAKSIKVVNEILGEIEIDHQQQQLQKDINQAETDLIDIKDTNDEYSKSNTTHNTKDIEETTRKASFKSEDTSNVQRNEEKSTRIPENTITQSKKSDQSITDEPLNSRSIARSLVVDIHIPPNEDERFLISEMSSKPIDGTEDPPFTRKEDSSFRPFKHEVNRSQRCYSDTSHLDKKRKYKSEHEHRGKKSYEDQSSSRHVSKCPDFLQNVDKIETICESTLQTSNNNKSVGLKPNLMGGFSLAHIKQHFFDSNKNISPQPKDKRKSDSDMDAYYHTSQGSTSLIDTKTEDMKATEATTSNSSEIENSDVVFSPFYSSGAKSKIKMSEVLPSGFNSCKELSPEHSTHKEKIDLDESQSKPTTTQKDFYSHTTLVNPNFAPQFSFESELMVRQAALSPPLGSKKIQSQPNNCGGTDGSLPPPESLPSHKEPTTSTMSFSIPQITFPSYFSKNNMPSFLFSNSSQTKVAASSNDVEQQKKDRKPSNSSTSPYTFFQMESDDDFDFDVVDDINNPRAADQDIANGGCGIGFNDMTDDDELEDLGGGRSRWYGDGSNQDRLISGSSFVSGEKQACLSQSSSIISMPVCRICQLPGMEPANHLISPCRCLGSIRYVHNNCLLKWLEVSNKRRSGPPSCELCQYQYLRHKKFVISNWRFPECSLKDKILHLFFIVSVCLMISCAAVTILCFKEDKNSSYSNRGIQDSLRYHTGELSPPEMITLSCGVLFFLAFFLAMYVEVKAKNTVYQLISKFFYMNHEWTVEEYDRKRDLFLSKKNKKKEEKNKKKRRQIRRQQRERYADDMEDNSDSIET